MSFNIKRIVICLSATACVLGTSIPMLPMIEAKAITIAVGVGELRQMEIKDDKGDVMEFVDGFENPKKIDYDGNDRDFYIIIPDDCKAIKFKCEVKSDDKRNDNYVVRYFKSDDNKAEAYEDGDYIPIKEDSLTIYARTYRSEDDFEDAYDDDDVKDCKETYTITLKRKNVKYDDSKEQEDENKSEIVEEQEEELSKELPTIIIDDSEEYIPKEDKNINKWVKKGIYWCRYDENGNLMKNTWFLDKENGNYYFLQPNTYATTGMRYIDGDFYYFDENRIMKTGWIKDEQGKWHYFDENGRMVKATEIDGYKIDAFGNYVE